MNDKIITADSLQPTNVEEAVSLLLKGFMPVGGGSDLIVRNHAFKKSGIKTERRLFTCSNIPETRRLEMDDDRFIIGSSRTLSEIIDSSLCPEPLRQSLLSIASPGIRNIATLAGNICNASPAADSLPALYILNAIIETAGTGGRRYIPVADFIQGPGSTVLFDDEILISISIKPEEMDHYFRKIGTRAANALSKLSVASVTETRDDVFTEFRLAVGACAPKVIRSQIAEQLVIGKTLTERARDIMDIISIYDELLTPIDDQRSTARYRKNTALKLIRSIILPGEEI